MKRVIFSVASVLLLLMLAGTVAAQSTRATEVTTGQVMVAKRSILAVKYIEDKETAVNIVGTALAPRVMGKADVEFKHGRARVKLELENLPHPQSLGPYYTTFILWAIAPEGQAENLAELPIRVKLNQDVTAKFQTFGLMITAEPHSAVKLPSPVIVAENSLRKRTGGRIESSQIEYRGDPGTLYVVSAADSPSLEADYSTPLLVLGARRAVEIARRAGAPRYAEQEFHLAEVKLEALEQSWPRPYKAEDMRKNEEKYSGVARDVMRLAELARESAGERRAQARLDAERRAASDTIAQAQSEADRAKADAERAKQAAAAYQEAMRRAESEAVAARQRVEQAQTEADKAKANEELARIEAERAKLQADEAKRERDEAQQRLFVSLSAILETRREARGLIVNLSDVLFDTGKATLKPGAREKLSKLAGILLAYPGNYRMEIEGHTDSVGSEDLNLKLSQARAESVRDYLLQGGLKSDRIIATRGFGKSRPVASNDTAAGRQVNRRVEIVISDVDTQTSPNK